MTVIEAPNPLLEGLTVRRRLDPCLLVILSFPRGWLRPLAAA